jgi:hypothetical protein
MVRAHIAFGWQVLCKDYSFRADPLTNMVATSDSCFWLADLKKKSSPLKLLSQMNRNLVWSNYGRSFIKIAHFISIRWQTWSPQTILVSDWPISNNLLLWDCLAKWAELWWEAPIEGSVCIKFPQSKMKGERHFQWAKHEHLAYHVDNEVSHFVDITSWIRYLSFFTV